MDSVAPLLTGSRLGAGAARVLLLPGATATAAYADAPQRTALSRPALTDLIRLDTKATYLGQQGVFLDRTR